MFAWALVTELSCPKLTCIHVHMLRRDPGNWATGLAGGAKFGYSLLFVILISNILAMFLQHLALKLGVASGRDLAQACRDAYPR